VLVICVATLGFTVIVPKLNPQALLMAVLCCAAGEALKFDPDHSPSRKAFNKLKDLDRKRTRATK
jgi:hypothetical protein